MENLISKVTTLLDSNVQFSAKNKKYHKIYKKKKKKGSMAQLKEK